MSPTTEEMAAAHGWEHPKDVNSRAQLTALAKPYRPDLVKAPAQGKYGSYVSHYVANQKALAILGPHSFELVNLIRGENNRVEGCTARLTAEIDGRTVSITEVGDCEQPTNWKTDGARAKDALSDAYKRCLMRLGSGLHLYVKADEAPYFLYDYLTKGAEE
jgi:hypothetical protein